METSFLYSENKAIQLMFKGLRRLTIDIINIINAVPVPLFLI